MRLIDADALIEKINEIKRRNSIDIDDFTCGKVSALNCAVDMIRDSQTIGGWIKCTPDTMPKTNDEVLTTYIVNGNQKRRYVKTASWFHDGEEGHWNSVWDEYRVPGARDEVLAWMPMPKPYKG